jgi:hypothetical protein
MAGPGLFLLLALPALFGLPLTLVGLVLRLCEWSWEKPPGSMGSAGLLVTGGVLCLPLLVGLGYALWPY